MILEEIFERGMFFLVSDFEICLLIVFDFCCISYYLYLIFLFYLFLWWCCNWYLFIFLVILILKLLMLKFRVWLIGIIFCFVYFFIKVRRRLRVKLFRLIISGRSLRKRGSLDWRKGRRKWYWRLESGFMVFCVNCV